MNQGQAFFLAGGPEQPEDTLNSRHAGGGMLQHTGGPARLVGLQHPFAVYEVETSDNRCFQVPCHHDLPFDLIEGIRTDGVSEADERSGRQAWQHGIVGGLNNHLGDGRGLSGSMRVRLMIPWVAQVIGFYQKRSKGRILARKIVFGVGFSEESVEWNLG